MNAKFTCRFARFFRNCIATRKLCSTRSRLCRFRSTCSTIWATCANWTCSKQSRPNEESKRCTKSKKRREMKKTSQMGRTVPLKRTSSIMTTKSRCSNALPSAYIQSSAKFRSVWWSIKIWRMREIQLRQLQGVFWRRTQMYQKVIKKAGKCSQSRLTWKFKWVPQKEPVFNKWSTVRCPTWKCSWGT